MTEYIVEKTLQQWFEQIVDYRLSMKERCSISKESPCIYLHPKSGNKCIIGYFIPNGHPAQKFQFGVLNLLKIHPELFGCVGFEHKSGDYFNIFLPFLTECQNKLHDTLEVWQDGGLLSKQEKLISNIKHIAKSYNLSLKSEWEASLS